MTTGWEYRVHQLEVNTGFLGGVGIDAPSFQAQLNELGADGWELVSSQDLNAHHGQSSILVQVFKRPRSR